jgi:hypothetical protein
VSFSHDGSTVYFLSAQNSVSHETDRDVSSVPFAGGTATALTDTDGVNENLPVGVLVDTTPPGATKAYGALLDVNPTLRWALPSDTDVAFTRVTRTAPGVATRTVDVPAPDANYVDRTTVLGTTYTYSFAAVDAFGNVGAAASMQLTATSARLGVPRPTTSVTNGSRFPVTFPVSASAKVWYQDRGGWVTAASPTALTPWNVPTSGSHVFGREGSTTAQQGHSYGFLFQVFDSHGNASLPHTFTTAVPRDNAYSVCCEQVVFLRGTNLYGGGAVVIRPGGIARVSVKGLVQIIGTTCPTCGVMAVHGAGHVWRFNTYSATRHDRVVLATLQAPADRQHAWVVQPEPSGTHRDIVLDALAQYV